MDLNEFDLNDVEVVDCEETNNVSELEDVTDEAFSETEETTETLESFPKLSDEEMECRKEELGKQIDLDTARRQMRISDLREKYGWDSPSIQSPVKNSQSFLDIDETEDLQFSETDETGLNEMEDIENQELDETVSEEETNIHELDEEQNETESKEDINAPSHLDRLKDFRQRIIDQDPEALRFIQELADTGNDGNPEPPQKVLKLR